MKKFKEDEEGFRKPVTQPAVETGDDFIDCYMHLEELKEIRDNKYYKKKLQFYTNQFKKYVSMEKR